jgi:hypothetical protein
MYHDYPATKRSPRALGQAPCVNNKTGQEVIDFDGEWLRWDHVLKLYFELQIPAEVEIGGRSDTLRTS